MSLEQSEYRAGSLEDGAGAVQPTTWELRRLSLGGKSAENYLDGLCRAIEMEPQRLVRGVYSRLQLVRPLYGPRTATFGCVTPDKTVRGAISVFAVRGGWAEIFNLFRDQHFRNQGMGRFLLQVALEHAQTEEVQYASLEAFSDNPALDMYASVGFVPWAQSHNSVALRLPDQQAITLAIEGLALQLHQEGHTYPLPALKHVREDA